MLRRYPVPQRAETCGLSEEYLGRWIKHRNIPRDSLVIATKVFSSIKLLSLLASFFSSFYIFELVSLIKGLCYV